MSDFSIISLGCPKNTVDSEKLAEQLCRNGFKIAPSEEDAAIIIVNTCAFIHEAERESIDTIIDILPSKKKNCKILAVAGCLPERYKQELVRALPDVDIFIGPNQLHELPGILKNGVREKQHCLFGIDPEANINFSQSRVLPEGTNYAYLKIADGCDHSCSFCIIPQIKGPYRSRPLKEIEREARELASSGIKELILIAQDTTGYGMDTEGKKMLPDLLRKISKIKGLRQLRLMYTYPGGIDDELLEVMAGSDVICKYIDMPLQHVSKNVLKMMKRGGSKAQFTRLLKKIRKVLPGCAIRSTFIVGHPGETEEDFQELMDFFN
ncbi:MAG: MiaB/RimO family radical SAM methylthiotransferase [Chloroflexi bacterium]|nr:MiaB/RimO family radical SAM methylthiotransferase [Chloroflexota bacterium]